MIKIFLAALMLSLSACTTPLVIGNVTQPVAVSDTVLIKGSDALSYAADAYAVTATLIEAAVRRGAFTDDQLRMIRTLSNHSIALLRGGNTALTEAQRAASVLAAVTQLRSILAKGK